MAGWRLMGLYLYCIGAADHPPPGAVAGIDGAAVSAAAVEGFSAWVSPLDAAPAPSLDRVREHNRVVERACAERTVLPLRFGQWFPDADALDASLHPRRVRLAADLERVAGAMEMGVRVMDPAHDDAPPDRSTGRAYLEALARRDARIAAAQERGARIAAEIRDWLGALVRDERVRPLGASVGLVAVAHLVDRHDIGGYNARLKELPGRYEDLRFHFSGPWPPYGFADDDSAEGR